MTEPQCPRCGMRGQHANALVCIDVLRDQLAVLSFKRETARERGDDAIASCHRAQQKVGGALHRAAIIFQHQPDQKRRLQKTLPYKRIVLLDGERVRLDVAAIRLGLSPIALYCRIRQRTGNNQNTEEVDVRAIGADISHRPWLTARVSRPAPCIE